MGGGGGEGYTHFALCLIQCLHNALRERVCIWFTLRELLNLSNFTHLAKFIFYIFAAGRITLASGERIHTICLCVFVDSVLLFIYTCKHETCYTSRCMYIVYIIATCKLINM